MLASASGPLGALLVIAPLAAIPVVAIVGIPQFAPVAASPNDEEEIGELGDSVATPAVVRPVKRRSADDLFAPLPGSGSGHPEVTEHPSIYGQSARGGQPARPSHGESAAADLGDNWEVVSPEPGMSLENRIGRGSDASHRGQTTGQGGVSPRGFQSGLLPQGSREANAARLEEMKRAGVGADRNSGAAAIPPGDPRAAMEFQNGAGLEAMQQMMMSEQSRWQTVSARIKELRIQKYRLEAKIEEPRFVFRCVFAAAQSSQVTQLFEADAETPIEAVEQVLQQVDEWLQSHDQTAALLLD